MVEILIMNFVNRFFKKAKFPYREWNTKNGGAMFATYLNWKNDYISLQDLISSVNFSPKGADCSPVALFQCSDFCYFDGY